MALYWPQRALALDIVDDPCSAPVDREAFPGLTVVELTRDQLAHPAAAKRALRRAGAGGGRDVAQAVADLLAHGGIAARHGATAAARGAGTVRHGGQDGGTGTVRWDG